jgi:ketosteroid isomerase-like protein
MPSLRSFMRPSVGCIRTSAFLANAAMWAVLAVPLSVLGQAMLTPDQVKQGYIEHAALAQLHRWYQPYENNAVPIENQLDILTEDVRLKSGLGEAVGHEAYQKRVAALPKTWKNAHRVGETKVQVLPDGQVQLQTQIEYLNIGTNPDGSLLQASLKYTTQLKPTDTVLPRFSSIGIEPVNVLAGKTYEDMYPQNRLKSLMHYWLALIEDPKRRLEPFKEILAKDFKLDFSSGAITDAAGFETWFRGPASAVAASTHQASNFSYQRSGDTTYAMHVDFDWQGILPNGTHMTAKTRHSWTVEDKVTERFARIKTLKVEVLKPFAPVPKS